MAKEQQSLREAENRQPLESILELGKQEFMKGEMAGIELFMALPNAAIEECKLQLEEYENAQNSS